jgi:uncharacterized protein (DUF58 family)
LSPSLATLDVWLARLPKPIADRLRLTFRRSFALRLTVEGYFLVGAMLLIGLAALNTGAPLLYLMFSMMCSFFVLSAILATNTIRGIEVSRNAPRVWQAGKPMPVQITCRNLKLFTSSYSLRLTDHLKGRLPAGAAFFDRIGPRGEKAREEYETLFLRRGVYKFESLDIATRFPFGLIERVITCQDEASILILPQTITVDAAMQAARSELGEHESNRKGAGAGLYGLREYTPDMPAKDIHWKLSARRQVLIAREYESEEKRRACVLLDNRSQALGPEAAEEFERAIIVAASVVEWLCRREHEVELRTASGIVGFGTGAPHSARCQRALAELGFTEDSHVAQDVLSGSSPGVFTIRVVPGGQRSGLAGADLILTTDEFKPQLKAAFQAPKDMASGKAELLSVGFRQESRL